MSARSPAQRAFDAYVDAFNDGDIDALVAVYAPDAVFHNPFSVEPLVGRDAIAAFVGPMFAAYCSLRADVDESLALTERIAARLTISARHSGELRGPTGPVVATGRLVEMQTAEFMHVAERELIVEHHRLFDSAAVLRQLGVAGSAT